MKSTIRLFRAVPIKSKKTKKPTSEILKRTIKRGFIFSPEVIANYNEYELLDLINIIERELGLTGEQLNSTFHKSWNKVKTASIEQLVVEQIIHYITTYGFEALGIYDKNSVFIPNEKLDIPDVNENIKLTLIKGYTKDEIKEKVLSLLQSGIALKEDTINDIIETTTLYDLTDEDVYTIKNKEVKMIMYSKMNIIPANPTEFVRYLVYRATGKTLLIKNPGILEVIKNRDNTDMNNLFVLYNAQHSYKKLSSVFNRFKPIFLAIRSNPQLRGIINKISKLSKKHHKPLPEDYLNNVTAKLSNGISIKKEDLEKELSKVNTFRKIRLAYALKFRTTEADSILYRVRNGKSYAKDFDNISQKDAERVLGIVLNSISKDISKNVKDKKIYMPKNITYTLPATEKQFVGNYPSGSYVSIPNDMVVGVHWNNVGSNRIDLDLSVINQSVGKIGWDSSYRTEGGDVLFSGDITNPGKNGATEAYYFNKQKKTAYIMMLNYFNFNSNIPVPFKIFVGKELRTNIKQDYMVDPNKVELMTDSIMDVKQKMLGLVILTTGVCRFYFVENNIGKGITSSNNKHTENARKYLINYYENSINLTDVLIKAGAKIVEDKEDCDINLSQESLEKDTILNLLA